MDILLVSEQEKQFGDFKTFLRDTVPVFVRKHKSVSNALIRYGMLPNLVSSIPEFHHNGTLPDSPKKQQQLLDRTFAWGSPPQVMVMSRSSFMSGSKDWYGFYQDGSITVLRQLVEQWQKSPRDEVLYRGLMAVVLHEVVHFLNDLIVPGSTVHTEHGHLRNTFHREAFGPIGWEAAHYRVIKRVLETRGVK